MLSNIEFDPFPGQPVPRHTYEIVQFILGNDAAASFLQAHPQIVQADGQKVEKGEEVLFGRCPQTGELPRMGDFVKQEKQGIRRRKVAVGHFADLPVEVKFPIAGRPRIAFQIDREELGADAAGFRIKSDDDLDQQRGRETESR